MGERANSNAGRLLGLAVLVLWFGALAAMAALYADQRFVSVPQLAAADAVAEVRIEQAEGTTGFRGEVVAVYKGDLEVGRSVIVEGVTESALSSIRPGQVWIVPLTQAGDRYQVTRYPLRAPVRIYRAVREVRRQVGWALRQASPSR